MRLIFSVRPCPTYRLSRKLYNEGSAQGKRYFAYQQKRNDYLYRLFSVGAGIGTGLFAFSTLAKNGDVASQNT